METSDSLTNLKQNSIQASNLENKTHSNNILINSISNLDLVNNELNHNSINKDNSENKIELKSTAQNMENKESEIQIELDKNKKNHQNNNYSKSPSYRNNRNLNNNHINININKVFKPFLTAKHILLNKYSLKEVNECIYKDYNQLSNILPYYQNYYFQNKIYNNYNYKNYNINNSNDAILICLKYIEYTNFFFNSNISYKVQNLLFNIIDGDKHILGQNKYNFLKNKLNEVYNKLIPYHIRYNYLKAFYDRNPEKSLYYLFKKDLDKISIAKHTDKKYLNYLYEIFEIVKQKMDQKKDNIMAYINKLYNNSINIQYNINNNKNGNYNNIVILKNSTDNNNEFHNSFNRRKNSYQNSSSQNNNISNYRNINTSNKNNYISSNIRKNDIYNKEISQFNINNYNLDNNYKSNFSTRNYYYKNNSYRTINNNDRDYLRNKNNNKNNSYFKKELVEVEDVHNAIKDENNYNANNNINNDFDEEEYKNLMIKKDNNKESSNEGNENESFDNLKINEIINNYDIDKNDLNNNNNIDELENIKSKINDTHINANIHEYNNIANENIQKNEIMLNNSQEILENKKIINLNEFNFDDTQKENISNKEENNNNKIKEKEELKEVNIINDINRQIDNNIINEEQIFHNDLKSFDFLYNFNSNFDCDNNNGDYNNEINNDNHLPKIIYNDFNSSNNSLNAISINSDKNANEINSKNITNKKIYDNNSDINNTQNNNISEPYISNNMINNYYKNITLNEQSLNCNDLNLILHQILLNQNTIMTNLNKFIFHFNQNKTIFNKNEFRNLFNNNFNIINKYNLGIINNLSYNSNNSHIKSHINVYSSKHEKMIESEYKKLKKLEKEGQDKIIENINLFEDNILLPIYNEISSNNNSEMESLYISVYYKYKEVIMSVITKNNLDGTIVEPYGSIINNFMTKNGDIDISIIPNKIKKEEFIKYLKEIENELIKEKKFAINNNNSIYVNSRYALLSIIDIESNINIDITVHNLLPIINSKMIRLYSLFDQRFHIIGSFLKHWVKINNIKGAPNGFLSSYALLILIIHFLQDVVEPKILPVLQEIRNVNEEYKYYYGEKELSTNIYYEEDFDKVKNYMNIINNGKENNLCATELLIQFFEFYAYKYNNNNNLGHYLISIKHKEKIFTTDCKQIAFPIEDPFDVMHNPGKSLKFNSKQYTEFIFCMKKEINNILSGEYFKTNFY